jgi:hypothetical protein
MRLIKQRLSLNSRIALNNGNPEADENMDAVRESKPLTVEELRKALVGDRQTSADFVPTIGRRVVEFLVWGSNAAIVSAD